MEPSTINEFTDILARVVERGRCIVPVYCFMPDHLHLLLTGTDHGSDLWKTIVAYKQKTGYWLSKNKSDLKWQKDFFDHIIRSDEKLGVHIKYILDNPVRKDLAASWQEYQYKGSVGCVLEDVLIGII